MTLDLTKISLTMTRTLDLRYLTHLTTTISIDVMTLHLRDLMKMTMMRMTSTNPDQDVSSDIAFNEMLDCNFLFPIALDVEMENTEVDRVQFFETFGLQIEEFLKEHFLGMVVGGGRTCGYSEETYERLAVAYMKFENTDFDEVQCMRPRRF